MRRQLATTVVRGRSVWGVLLTACSAAAWAGGSGRARADAQTQLRYDCAQIWASTHRMLRVDLDLPVREHDKDAGYILFDYPQQGRSHAGSFEMICAKKERQVRFRIASLPGYVATMLVDKLERKLLADHGEAPAGDAKPPPRKAERSRHKARNGKQRKDEAGADKGPTAR